MITYVIEFTPEAEEQLTALVLDIARSASSTMIAQRYVTAIVDHCEALSAFPKRGAMRDDIRPGLRLTNYRGRAVIAFSVDDASATVSIIGIFYGGQDYETALASDLDGPPE